METSKRKPPDLARLISSCQEMLTMAAAIAMQIRRSGVLGLSVKEGKNCTKEELTHADLQIQQMFDEELPQALPGVVIIGEESFTSEKIALAKKADCVAIIDPIDGTKNFVAGDNGYCHALTILWQGRALYSAVFAPEYDIDGSGKSLFEGIGLTEGQAFLNSRQISVNPRITDLSQAKLTLYASSKVPSPPYYAKVKAAVQTAGFNQGGSGLINACLIACSLEYPEHETLYLKPTPSVWDIIHAAAIVEMAKGKAAYDDGSPLFPLDLGLFDFSQTGTPRLPSSIIGVRPLVDQCLELAKS